MSKEKTPLCWKPIINQRKYGPNDTYKEGDNEVYLECPRCNQRVHFDLIKTPSKCPSCGVKLEGIKV